MEVSNRSTMTRFMSDKENTLTEELAEAEAISTFIRVMSGLNEEARTRVAHWFSLKCPTRSSSGFRISQMPLVSADKGRVESGAASSADAQQSEFPDLAALVTQSRPSNETERTLVAAFWHQVVQKSPDVDAFAVNKELKHLGYPVENITRAFGGLMNTVPQLAIQTRKSGTSRQARKRYRLTSEGINRVNQMISTGQGEK